MKKNDRLELLQELGNIGIFEWYFDTEITYISKKIYTLFGLECKYIEDRIDFKEDTEITKHFEVIKKIITEVKKSKGNYDELIKLKKVNDGEYTYLRFRASYVSKEDEPSKIYGIVSDETRDVLNKGKIKVINERFGKAIEKSPFPIMIHTEDGEMIHMNAALLEQSGYDFEEINTGEKWMRKVHPGRVEYNTEFVKRNFEAEEILVQGETEEVHTKNNGVRMWQFHNALLGPLDDGRNGMLTTCLDVTDQLKHEKEQDDLLRELNNTKIFLEASLNSPEEMVIVAFDKNYNYYFFNQQHEKVMSKLYGCNVKEKKKILDCIIDVDDRKKEKANYDRALNGESFSLIEKYGEDKLEYFETYYNPVKNKEGDIIGVILFTQNVSQRIEDFLKIKESEEKFRLIYSSMSQSLAVHEIITDENNKPIDYRFVDINKSYEDLFGYNKDDIIGRRIKDVSPQIEQYWIDVFGKVALTGEPSYYENYSSSANKHFSTYSYSPKPGQFAVLISDITERIERDKEIRFLSYNDQLTGVYNRRYYEAQMVELDTEDNLPFSLIMGDVNGLKLVNDSFGHLVGDELLIKVSSILKKACRSTDVITRIGGDEFVILLPKTSYKSADKVIRRIKHLTEIEQVESIDISISFGYGTKTDSKQNLLNIFKNIEDEMYRNKLIESGSMRSKTVDLIKQTLYEKNTREMNHSKRVSKISELIAKEFSNDADFINQVRVGGLMHDIGKIGIDEIILNKEGSLTKDEWTKTKKHSEIGYRILSSISEFSEIANHILEHHERWDGSGYPKGIAGNDISIQARIIGVADAFDAMTGPRTYKSPITPEEAKDEILRCSGTDFDPKIVEVFIEKVYTIIKQD